MKNLFIAASFCAVFFLFTQLSFAQVAPEGSNDTSPAKQTVSEKSQGSSMAESKGVEANDVPATTVESLFQLNHQSPSVSINKDRKTKKEKKLVFPSEQSKKHGFVFHLLDNIGVPVPTGKIDGLDSSLHGTTSKKGSHEKKASSPNLERIQPPGQNASDNSHSPVTEKIPAGELEGTMYDSAPATDKK